MNKIDFAKTKGKTDEWFTPETAVYPILSYLNKEAIIWCPFDTEESNFVKVLVKKGFNVVYSHIENGEDFFEYTPEKWDIIVSNPPYSIRNKILERCFSFKKPFALLMNTNGIFDSKIRYEMFRKNHFSLFYLRGRVNYMKEYGKDEKSSPPFQSAYILNLLSKDKILFETAPESYKLIY